MVGSTCNSKMHVRNLGYPFPLQIGTRKTTFLDRLRNLMVYLTAFILGTKHDIDIRSSVLQTTTSLPRRPKMSWTLVRKWLKTRSAYLPTLRKFCILLHCQLCRWRSANGTQPNFARTNCYRKVEAIPPTRIVGQNNFAFVPFFDDFET